MSGYAHYAYGDGPSLVERDRAANVEGNRRRLGKAVHPAALARLHELYPNAVVRVRHETTAIPLLGELKMDGPRTRPARTTRVLIDPQDGVDRGGIFIGEATCHFDDAYNRRTGIEVAWRRAFREACEVAKDEAALVERDQA